MPDSRTLPAPVRLGPENQENREREFFKRLQQNLANDDPGRQHRKADEFRALILGHCDCPA
ncbi:MAG TPA: hypothetical protein VGE89_17475 [Bryobacteraceae bacterium]